MYSWSVNTTAGRQQAIDLEKSAREADFFILPLVQEAIPKFSENFKCLHLAKLSALHSTQYHGHLSPKANTASMSCTTAKVLASTDHKMQWCTLDLGTSKVPRTVSLISGWNLKSAS